MYSMYGLTFDPTSESAISSAQESVINGLIEQAVVDAKMDELGIELTEEDLAEIQSESESTYQGYKDTIKSAVYSDTELTGDELEAAIEETMTQYGYPTLDEIVENNKTTKRTEKLKAEVVKDVTVTDEEVQTEYDSRVEKAKSDYESNPGSYGTSVTNGTTVYYTPAGYRYVKNILRPFSHLRLKRVPYAVLRLCQRLRQSLYNPIVLILQPLFQVPFQSRSVQSV